MNNDKTKKVKDINPPQLTNLQQYLSWAANRKAFHNQFATFREYCVDP